MTEGKDCQPSPRAECPYKDEEFVELIADRAKEKVITDLSNDAYLFVGRLVIRKFIYFIGIIGGGIYVWLVSNGYITPQK